MAEIPYTLQEIARLFMAQCHSGLDASLSWGLTVKPGNGNENVLLIQAKLVWGRREKLCHVSKWQSENAAL